MACYNPVRVNLSIPAQVAGDVSLSEHTSCPLIYAHRPSKSLKTLHSRQLFQKTSAPSRCQPTIRRRRFFMIQMLNSRFRSNFMREVLLCDPSQSVDRSSNYDITVFYVDELDDTQAAVTRRGSKKIPRWSRFRGEIGWLAVSWRMYAVRLHTLNLRMIFDINVNCSSLSYLFDQYDRCRSPPYPADHN